VSIPCTFAYEGIEHTKIPIAIKNWEKIDFLI
jgi:hypothetical protein